MDLLTYSWLIIDIITLAIVLGAKFINVLPGFLQDLMVYGKTRQGKYQKKIHWLQELLLVPNRWFIHFYALGLVWNVFLLLMALLSIVKELDTPFPSMLGIVDTTSPSKVDCSSGFLTLVLLTIQLSRRLYECLFVSSFSGKMHLGHYVIGVLFYFLVNLTVVAEIPLPSHTSCLKLWQQLSWSHCLAVLLFFWASYHQYQCHTILGKLTTWTPDGKKIYKIPHGDWFEHVSSPHYLAEILIYIALFAVMKGQSIRWILVLIFVVLNLTLGAQNTHLWYKEKFDNYPRNRYIILPYVY